MATKGSRPKVANRWNVAARALAAIPANYVLTSLTIACFARLLPTRPEEASVAATLFSFVLFAVLALTAFAVRSVGRLWLAMVGAGLLLGGGFWLSITAVGRL